MSILITGGLGHVGSWVAYALAKKGKRVIICDMAANHFNKLGLDYLEEIHENLVLEAIDVLDYHSLFEKMLKYRDEIEGVIHGVSVIAGPTFQQRPFRNLTINTLGTLNVYETCRILGIRKIVNMSSGAVYGDAEGYQSETTPYKATDLYSATKISGELFGDQYTQTYGMDIRHARLFSVYGPGKLPSHMHLVYQALFGPLEGLRDIYTSNGGDQHMDWTHVHDTANGVALLFEKEKVTRRHYNISCGEPIHNKQIVREVINLLGYDSGMQLGPGPFVVRGAPLNINSAKEELGFSPKYVNMSEGLKDYSAWLQKRSQPRSI